MRKLRMILTLIVLVMGIGIGKSEGVTINKIVGIASSCDNSEGCIPIPLVVSSLCTAVQTCPLLSAPSYTDSLRFWGTGGTAGIGCRTSIDGGATWGACASEPFGLGAKEHYAGAADGGVIAISQIAGDCVVRRSEDNAASWTTVFTFTMAAGCGGPISGGTLLKCFPDGECSHIATNTTNGQCTILNSTSSGTAGSWTAGITTAACFGGTVVGASYDGDDGIMTQSGMTLVTGFFTATGFAGWGISALWPTGVGSCWGSVVLSLVARAICYNTGDANYRLRDVNGVVVRDLVMPNAFLAMNNGGLGMSIGDTNVLYVVATSNNPSAIGVWASRDGGVSFGRIGTVGPGVSIREGDIFFANGCIYFSGGVITPVFAKVCVN